MSTPRPRVGLLTPDDVHGPDRFGMPLAVTLAYRELRAGHGVAIGPLDTGSAHDLRDRLDRHGLLATVTHGWSDDALTTMTAGGVAVLDRAGPWPAPVEVRHVGRASAATPAAPLRVALLGLGTVGVGVYAGLAAEPERFQVVAVMVRDPARHPAQLAKTGLLVTSLDAALSRSPDLVIELMGGTGAARDAVVRSLASGVPVVTANKALIAGHRAELHAAIDRGGLARKPRPATTTTAGNPFDRVHAPRPVGLRFSAAVGGAMPALELAQLARVSAGRVARLRGIVNGTCNFMLGLMSRGHAYADALAAAQRAGFAEADPTLDVNGSDAAQKLTLLLAELSDSPPAIDRRGIDTLDTAQVRDAVARSRVIKLVAEATFDPNGQCASATVMPRELAPDDDLARVDAEWNRLVIELADGGRLVATAKGAGRYPTALAVLADLDDAADPHGPSA